MEEKKDKLAGQFEESKGDVKEGLGKAFDDEQMEAEGRMDQGKGKFDKGVAGAKEEAGERLDDMKDKLDKGVDDLKGKIGGLFDKKDN